MSLGENLLWTRKSNEILQLWSSNSKQYFLQPQPAGSHFAGVRNSKNFFIPCPPLFDSLKARGISNSAIVELSSPYYMSRLSTDFHFLSYTLSGIGILKSGKRSYRIKKGDIMFIPAGNAYDLSVKSSWTKIWFHVENSDYWNSILGDKICVKKSLNISNIEFAAKKYLEEMRKAFPQVEILDSLTILICSWIKDDFEDLNSRNCILDALMADFLDNPSMKITAKYLAKRFGISKYELDKMCYKAKGINMAKYICEKRMEMARDILSSGKKTLSEISAYLGFSDAYSFSKSFKRFHGITPKAFRSRLRVSS